MSIESFNIVLVEPEIPQNTGNIIRLCACTNARLFLVGPLGFSMTDKYMKRSGLDYHNLANINKRNSLAEVQAEFPESKFYYFTTKSEKSYFRGSFKKGDFLVFGPETRGLDENLLSEKSEDAYTIPMIENRRSLNLSNSVSIVLYEAIRQNLEV